LQDSTAMLLRIVWPWNERLLRIDDDRALIEGLPDTNLMFLGFVPPPGGGFPALFDLQQGVVSAVGSEVADLLQS
jgi:hypothetical protein